MKTNITKHPQSLKVFFGTEMWERYGFYVVQTLLALYLSLYLKWNDDRTYALVGSFTALTYLSPVIGGWIADKMLGQKAAVISGIIFLLLSYCLLSAFDSDLALTSSLAGIAVGTGLLKPNISSLLGNEYPPGSSRRESGFTIFYMGITTGIILGTTLPSQLYFYFGWSTSFASAIIGMIFSFFVFVYGMMVYKIQDYNPSNHNWQSLISAFILILLLWAVSFYIMYYPDLANLLFAIVVFLSAAYLFYSIKKEAYKQARLNIVIGLLCIISVTFWTFYFQMFLSLTLFIERVVKPTVYGIQFPPPYYVTVQSLGMIFFGYFLSKNREKLNLIERGKNTAKKFLMAILLITLGYVIIDLVCYLADPHQLISPFYILPAYLLISLAELLLSPVGLSAITVLASRDKVSTMMGIFFVSLGLGGFLSGKLASITAISPQEKDLPLLRAHYATTFTEILIILIIASIVCLALYGLIQYLLKDMKTEEELI